MWKQAIWFAVVGSVAAVLASAAGDLAMRVDAIDIFDGGSRFVSRYHGPEWDELCAILVVGAAVGAVLGLAAYWSGIRMAPTPGNRVALVVAAGVVGVAVGLMPALLLVASALWGLNAGESIAIDPVSLLALYGVSAALAYGAALFAVHLALRFVADPCAASTTRCTAVLLLVGGVAATAGGVGTGWAYHFNTRPQAIVVIVLVVVLTLSATFAAARVWALRRSRPFPTATPSLIE